MAVGVGESEINDFYVAAVVGDHDVRRLEVAVNHLLLVDVCHGVHQFAGDASPGVAGFLLACVEEIGERGAVDPFSHEAGSPVAFGERHFLHAIGLRLGNNLAVLEVGG